MHAKKTFDLTMYSLLANYLKC